MINIYLDFIIFTVLLLLFLNNNNTSFQNQKLTKKKRFSIKYKYYIANFLSPSELCLFEEYLPSLEIILSFDVKADVITFATGGV